MEEDYTEHYYLLMFLQVQILPPQLLFLAHSAYLPGDDYHCVLYLQISALPVL